VGAPGNGATLTVQTTDRAEALAGRLFDSMVGLMDLAGVYIGDRLGFYEALEAAPGSTPAELAARTGTQERPVREWLEHQAVSGLLDVEENGERRYRLPAGAEEVFLDPESLAFSTPLARYGVGLLRPLDQLLRAFREGGGVELETYGDDVREAQAAVNRPQFANLLATEWLSAIADVDARLRDNRPARIADVCCGAGWSSIVMAREYPNVRVDGFDLDAPAIEMARANARSAGVEDRVRFHVEDAAQPDLAGRYDLVTVFEAIHDLPRPIEVLRAMRRLAGPEGTVLVVDERTADTFTAPGDDMERALYGYSLLLCLPTALTDEPSAATGTVMRADTLRDYARAAGFADSEVLPVAHPQFRLYRLR
jgi:SAM-dependent methyltransferase